jgi:subtilisin-like proprotein convertase family protein/subtilisin family serine protease
MSHLSNVGRFSKLFAGLAVAAMTTWGCGSPPQNSNPDPQPGAQTSGSKVAFAKDSVIVRFRNTPTVASARSSLSRIKGTITDKNNDGVYDAYAHIAGGSLAVVQLDKSVTVEKALAQLRSDPSVLYAEPNYIVHTSTVPNDARFAELYGMNNTGQTGGTADADIDAVEAWDSTTGSARIVVGVVDTGIDYNHEDLAANVWINPNEIAGNGLDDDGNGYIDDVHGINAITGTGDPMDDNSHGSHCSGTIGGVGGNGIGVAGVNWEVQIMGLKFLDAGGSGSLEAAITAIDYAVAMKNAGVNLRVLSNSWGGGGFSQALQDAIQAANDVDILFVAAAGNSGTDNDVVPEYPSGYDVPNVIAVAATDHNDGLAGFSEFGLTTVDLGAPGVDILSTTPGNTYSVFSGTSMATPHVSGVAALVLSANETLSTAELKDILINSGDPVPSLAGKTVSGKRLNAASAVAEAGPPVPRFNMGVTPANQVVTQEDTATYNIDLASVAGFTGDVALSAAADPSLTVAISPAVVAAPGTATLTVGTSQATPVGVYNIVVTGQSGELVKTRTVQLRVRAFGTVDQPYPSTDTPIAIPDVNPTGITSVINVPDALVVQEVRVDLNVTHTYIGDLLITLTSPLGTVVTLHNHAGGSADDIHQTYTLPVEFTGQGAQGPWTLHIQDDAAVDVGTLDSWTLHIVGVPGQGNDQTFAITTNPSAPTVRQGESATVAVDVAAVDGFAGSVTLSASAPSGFYGYVDLFPSLVTVPGTSALSITTYCYTNVGDYPITITGRGSNGQTRVVTMTLHVRAPGGPSNADYASSDTPIAIPDANPNGIVSTINVSDSSTISALTVDVNITHTFIGDLVVSLVGPNGTVVPLSVNQGGAADDIHQTFTVTAFDGLSVAGAWKLTVVDSFAADVGTLDSWTLHVASESNNPPPTAAFSAYGDIRTFTFYDFSNDAGCGGGIVGRTWDFGDGSTSTEVSPTHTYAVAGTYNVTLTVTDTGGATASTTQQVVATRDLPRLAIMGVTRNPDTFEFSVSLKWSGADGDLVELYRNGALADIPDNDGTTVDLFRRYQTTYNWQICEQYSSFCSNQVSIVFGELDNQVTVISTDGDSQKVEQLMVRDVRPTE